MPLTLGLNLSSLRAQTRLSRTSDELSQVYTRLSSGQRINRASDDAAGLAVADSLRTDSRVYNQGVRNINDGISILNVADGALNELANITVRLTELAEQASNGVLGKLQRASLDEEAQALSDEYFRIAKSTEFNGRKLFEGDYGELRLQAGYGVNGSIGDGLGGAIGTGEFKPATTFTTGSTETLFLTSADLNGDGYADLVSSSYSDGTLNVQLGNGNGGYSAQAIYTSDIGTFGLDINDVNNDGILDLVSANIGGQSISTLLGNGDGTFQSALSTTTPTANYGYVEVGDFNNDGNADILTTEEIGTEISISFGNGDGTFGSFQTVNSTANGGADIITYDFNSDGLLDFATSDTTSEELDIYLNDGNSNFTFTFAASAIANPGKIVIADFNGDGEGDLAASNTNGAGVTVALGNGDGTFQSSTTLVTGANTRGITTADFNGDGSIDIAAITSTTVEILLGQGDGSFDESVSTGGFIGLTAITAGDFNNDGVADLALGDGSNGDINLLLADTNDGVAPLLEFSLSSQTDATQALSMFQNRLDILTTQRGEIGGFMARLLSATNVLQATTDNYEDAESRIRDADIAKETSEFVRLNILQDAASAVLAQANLQPELVLQVLQGGS